MKVALTGNDAAATAMKHINPDVVAAYPITPQTELMHKFAELVSDGEVDTEFILVESEHSAMSAVIGSAAAGARSMTATSANGLALMWEMLYIAASSRLPIVMPVVNRALSAPINIHADHSDSMGARDSGWIQFYSENPQEVYDNVVQAIKIAENKDVLLPVMVCSDGFITSHTVQSLEISSRDEVQDFIGEYQPAFALLDLEHPQTIGPLALQNYYFEYKRQQVEGMANAKAVILEVAQEFAEISGREYGFFDAYRLDDADVAIVILNSTAGTAKDVSDELRNEGIKAGVLKLRCFRPFPQEEIVEALKNVAAIAVMDRAQSSGAFGGTVFNEVRSAFYQSGKSPRIVNYIYGLGGRDVNMKTLRSVYEDLLEIAETDKVEQVVNFLGVRE